MMRHSSLALGLAVLFAAGPLAAQNLTSPDGAVTPSQAPTSALQVAALDSVTSSIPVAPQSAVSYAPAGARMTAASQADAPLMVMREHTTDNVALMIVGGAGILVGSVVGGDGGQIIMISGAVVGLIGLYRYLR